jgi:prepilin-type N-terminal cleavage/methylation domain-containing protein
MNSTTKSDFCSRRLPVLWLDSLADGPLVICRRNLCRVEGTPQREKRAADPLCRSGGIRLAQERHNRPAAPHSGGCAEPAFVVRGLRAFTLLELMVVIAIIGFIAALALPHVSGFSRANSMAAATRQFVDDCGLARRRAIINRSTVYMVFVPPTLWSNEVVLSQIYGNEISNLVTHQFAAYALISLGTVGDQPGRHYPQYVTDWRILPDGVFIAPFQFNLLPNGVPPNNVYIYTTNTLTGTTVASFIQPWTWLSNSVPFPSLSSTNFTYNLPMPCIGFTPSGSLTTPFTNQYIVLARGNVTSFRDTNGAPILQPAFWSEAPPGNDTNNANLIKIDWMTGRATVVQNRLQ